MQITLNPLGIIKLTFNWSGSEASAYAFIALVTIVNLLTVPLFIVMCINTLFPAAHIQYTLENWAATVMLYALLTAR